MNKLYLNEKCQVAKLFYNFINGKFKVREDITKVKVEGKIAEDPEEMAEVFNRCFQSVFTKEQEFREGIAIMNNGNGLKEAASSTEEVKIMLDNLDVRKAMGPDGVSNWILKECSTQLAGVIHNIVSTTMTKGKIPKD